MTLQASSAGDGHLSGVAGALVDESLVGLLLLDSRGAVVETNQRGRDVLSAAGGLRVRAKGTLAGLEDEYFTKCRSDAAEALVLTMGQGGKVLAVSSLKRAVEVSHVR